MTKRLTELSKTSGWAGKIGPDILAQVLRQLPKMNDERLLVGLETSDDAAIYKINDELALIETLDFFTPVVDDPFIFGQIAATNSLSDVYAMGGEPILAMNIVCFPNCLSPDVLVEILKGGANKVKEAGAVTVGGHTVEDEEPKYGLSVSGFVHPDKILVNSNAKIGDILIITKPLGLGIINTAIKGEMADKEAYNIAVKLMTTLNKYAKEAIDKVGGVNSLTDITGFGLIGHGVEMAKGSGVTIKIDHKKIPIIPQALEYADMGLVPAGAYANKGHTSGGVYIDSTVPQNIEDILFDPQTSGGLLISVKESHAEKLLDALKDTPTEFAIIGHVVEQENKFIIVT